MKGVFALKHKLRLTLVAILAVAALGAVAPAANAYIYWADAQNPPRIQRADNDGTNRVENFVNPDGGSSIFGVAVDANYIYWTDPTAGTIGRANLDGSNANNAFIDEIPNAKGIAVDAGHIYWVTDNPNNATVDYLYKANLDGTLPTVISSLTAGTNPMGIAVDSTYIYWTQRGTGKLGRATLNLSTSNQAWITTTSPSAVAVNASHVYWANFVNAPSDSSIGRANIGSTSQNQSFVTGAKSPYGIALNSSYLYWGNSGTTSIGRSGLDGSSPNQSFVTNAGDVRTIAANALDPVGSLTPSSNAFGNQPIAAGATSASTFTLTSSGSANLTIPASGITLTGTNADQFQVSGGTCSAGSSSLANAQTCTVTVTFDPTSTGAKSASLEVQTNDGTKTATLTGTGTAPAGSFSPSSLSFGNQLVSGGGTATVNMTLTSTGSADLVLASGLATLGDDYSDFPIDSATCKSGTAAVVSGTTLSNGESCVITVAFDPTSTGAKSMTLSIDTNDGTKTATLTGTGIAPAGSLSPPSNDYGSHLVGTETAATYTVTSTGSADLDIEGMGIGGSGGENFGLLNDGTCSPSTQLSNGQSCTIIVNFSPTSTGAKLATLDITTNDGLKSVALSGTGTANPTISSVGKPTKTSLKVKVGCGDASACSLRLTGKKVGTNAATTPKTVAVGAGQQPTVTLAYTKALKTAVARGGTISVTATNTASGLARSITLRVSR